MRVFIVCLAATAVLGLPGVAAAAPSLEVPPPVVVDELVPPVVSDTVDAVGGVEVGGVEVDLGDLTDAVSSPVAAVDPNCVPTPVDALALTASSRSSQCRDAYYTCANGCIEKRKACNGDCDEMYNWTTVAVWLCMLCAPAHDDLMDKRDQNHDQCLAACEADSDSCQLACSQSREACEAPPPAPSPDCPKYVEEAGLCGMWEVFDPTLQAQLLGLGDLVAPAL